MRFVMKKMALSLLTFSAFCLSAATTFASPYAVTGKFPTASVNTCIFVFNESPAIETAPVSINSEESICKYDLVSAKNGNNVISIQYKNIWGVSSTVPFSFAKTLPPTPSDIMLSE